MKLSELKQAIAHQSNIERQLESQRDQLADLIRLQAATPTESRLGAIQDSLVGLSHSLASLLATLQEQATAQQALGLQLTAAINALEHDADIAKVQDWLGHANVSTTRLYDRRKMRPEDSPTFRVSY